MPRPKSEMDFVIWTHQKDVENDNHKENLFQKHAIFILCELIHGIANAIGIETETTQQSALNIRPTLTTELYWLRGGVGWDR